MGTRWIPVPVLGGGQCWGKRRNTQAAGRTILAVNTACVKLSDFTLDPGIATRQLSICISIEGTYRF